MLIDEIINAYLLRIVSIPHNSIEKVRLIIIAPELHQDPDTREINYLRSHSTTRKIVENPL